MNLLNLKKIAVVGVGLLIAMTAQKTLADANQIFCHTKSGNDWYWTGDVRDNKTIDSHISADLPLLAYRKSENNGLYIRTHTKDSYQHVVDQPSAAAGGKMNESRARKFCEAVMNFCVTPTTSSYRHIGIGPTWDRSLLNVEFTDDQGRDAVLSCPNYFHNKGWITTFIGNTFEEKSAEITYPR